MENTQDPNLLNSNNPMMAETEVQYAVPWMMICMVNPSVMEGRKLVRLMDRILREKTPQCLKAWM